MIWGDPIEVNGIRPAWLADDERIQWMKGQDWRGPCDAKDHNWGPYIHTPNTETAAIRLSADHFAYLAIAKGYQPWGGGDSAPEDWDSGEVLLRGGYTYQPDKSLDEVWTWEPKNDPRDMASEDCVGYKRKQATDDGDYVSVKRMTEAEAKSRWSGLAHIHTAEALRELGLIRQPSQAETIAIKTGLTVDQVQSVLNEVNNGTR